MSGVRTIVKRRDNGKHVSKMNYCLFLLKAEYLKKINKAEGIYSVLSPQNAEDQYALESAREKHEAVEVKARKVDSPHPNHLFNDLAFPVLLAEWWIIHHPGKFPQIDRISKKIAFEQRKIVDGLATRNIHLETLFKKFARHLINRKRSNKWWEERFAQLRKIQKSQS